MNQNKLNFDFTNKQDSKSARQYIKVVKSKSLPAHMIEEESKVGLDVVDSRNINGLP